MNVIISQQAAENERSSRLSGVQRESSYLLLSVFSGRKVFKTLEKFSLTWSTYKKLLKIHFLPFVQRILWSRRCKRFSCCWRWSFFFRAVRWEIHRTGLCIIWMTTGFICMTGQISRRTKNSLSWKYGTERFLTTRTERIRFNRKPKTGLCPKKWRPWLWSGILKRLTAPTKNIKSPSSFYTIQMAKYCFPATMRIIRNGNTSCCWCSGLRTVLCCARGIKRMPPDGEISFRIHTAIHYEKQSASHNTYSPLVASVLRSPQKPAPAGTLRMNLGKRLLFSWHRRLCLLYFNRKKELIT